MKTKHYFSLFIIAAALQACSSDSGSNSDKCQCGDDEKCYEDVCYPIDACKPDCTGTDKCYKGQCIKQDQCAPECKEDEKCYEGTCYSLDTCKPDCTSDYQCVNGECQKIDPTKCVGTQCKSQTEYCDETGHWAECAAGEGCHLGYCIEGLAPECKEGECHDSANKKCSGGKWKACGSLEQCVNGECEVTSDACEAGSCSEDKQYRCNDEGNYETCGLGSECFEGECVSNFNRDDAMLWQLCTKNSDCAFGSCIFELSTSNLLTNISISAIDAKYIPVSALDSRIPEGTGICSADCTQSASACDTLTEADSKVKFTCQLMTIGDSPYPPKDNAGNPLTLPFSKSLDLNLMKKASYAAACRPNDAGEYYYSNKFCSSCATSDDCGDSEVCDLGMCLKICSSSDMCPIGFSCKPISGSDLSACMPATQTCGDCIDTDGDGQGFGHCEKEGFDCDDYDPTTYYTTEKPVACTDTSDDKNCNGTIDRFELIGTADNCTKCGDLCPTVLDEKDVATKHYTRACVSPTQSLPDDYNPDAFDYTCQVTCAAGYADCDGDKSNGCEVQIVNINSTTDITATVNGIEFALDNDGDGYGTPDLNNHHYCCQSNESVCYTVKQITTASGTASVWSTFDPDETKKYIKDEKCGTKGYQCKLNTDCNDDDAKINPGQKDICNGKDDDCNSLTADGSASQYVDPKTKTKYDLGSNCNIWDANQTAVCSNNGVVKCSKDSAGNAQMVCYNPNKIETETDSKLICNGKDDNCDGQIDEDWNYPACETGKKGICAYGIQLCSNGKKECHQLFQPRRYDFYGDGIDSNCDGYDYDVAKAIFIEASGDGSENGTDENAGHIDSPVATLSKAISLACNKGYCQDIFISSAVKSLATSGIELPTFGTVSISKVTEVKTLAEHYEDYKSQGSSYDANNFLFTDGKSTEVYYPKHALRIYGGMTRSTDNVLTYSSPNTSSHSITITDFNNAVERTLLYPNPLNLNPLSLAIHNMRFSILSSTTPEKVRNDGVTVAGLQCGKGGCQDLLLDNVQFTVTAPTGKNNSDIERTDSVEIWDEDSRKPIVAVVGLGVNSRFKNHYTNYKANQCIADEQHGAGGSNKVNDNSVPSEFYLYTDETIASLLALKCPDGATPNGGCGGHVCSKNNCTDNGDSTSQSGKQGNGGYNPGNGANLSSVNRKDSCSNANNSKDIDDGKISTGANGGNGPGGKGGNYQDITFSWKTRSINGFKYLDSSTYKGSGKYGTTGGAGGGGGVYRAYSRQSYKDGIVVAASGGAGGCGGRGGVAGGTGGTAIGIVVTPPKDTSKTADIQLINNTYFTVTGGAGGASQAGENGIKGTPGGDWMALHQKSGALDTQCHRTSGSGAGGAGGGGGAGAGGRAGHAYGLVFACNRYVKDFAGGNTSKLSSCGFILPDPFIKKPANFTKVDTKQDKANGTSGSTSKESTLGGFGGSSTSSVAATYGNAQSLLLIDF